MTHIESKPVALITGISRGLGFALTAALFRRGWLVIGDGRDADRLKEAATELPGPTAVTPIPGDVADAAHRRDLADAVLAAGRLDLLVNNASVLGPSPQPLLADYPADELARVYAVNTVAPIAMFQLVLPHLQRSTGTVVNVTSDAAVEAYEGWGGYGSSKAALEHATAIIAAENPTLRVYAFDPGDMNTDLHQQAFPGEDISDRAAPDSVVPALLRLIEGDLPSGRHRAAELAVVAS